uniref:Transmembrane protein 138 n=1 Tax=Phaeomonas parva TaxID=124430 RepID=A0A7S1TSS8_9STRA|mmetsp:Transcript_15113/g.45530  ORF Transcript_15113/g.45530 Transcript_15113/m.45530 type:complete len:173 (+) Transcript_15113:117-635(+)
MAARGCSMWAVTMGIMVLFLVADLALNSSVEHDTYVAVEQQHLAGGAYIMVYGCHVVLQVSTFIVLVLMMGETYLFQVGLLQILASQFPAVLIIHPVYMLYTIVLGAVRTSRLVGNSHVTDLWADQAYAAFSVGHKMIAVVYYVLNLRAAVKLGDPVYYQRQDAWRLANAGK